MFEELIKKRTKEEQSKTRSIMVYTAEGISKSELSLFTKGFVSVETSGEKINPDILIQLIEKSVKLSFNYTLRPKWTLLNYIFGSLESVPVNKVMRKLEIFRYYKFYEDSIKRYINEKNPLALMKKRVVQLFDDADTSLHDKLLTEPSSVKTKNFFLQIFKLKYGDLTDLSLNASIPFGYIRIFLEDKGFYGLLERFYIINKLADSKEVELKDIIKIISGKFVSDNDSSADIAVTTSSSGSKLTEEEYIYTSASDEMKNTFEEESEEEKPAEKKSIREHKEKYENINNEKILKFFSREEAERITKKIFSNNRIQMYKTFDEMNKYSTWDEAAEYLKEVFIENKVDIYNKDVVLFIDVINDYFSKKSG